MDLVWGWTPLALRMDEFANQDGGGLGAAVKEIEECN